MHTYVASKCILQKTYNMKYILITVLYNSGFRNEVYRDESRDELKKMERF